MGSVLTSLEKERVFCDFAPVSSTFLNNVIVFLFQFRQHRFFIRIKFSIRELVDFLSHAIQKFVSLFREIAGRLDARLNHEEDSKDAKHFDIHTVFVKNGWLLKPKNFD